MYCRNRGEGVGYLHYKHTNPKMERAPLDRPAKKWLPPRPRRGKRQAAATQEEETGPRTSLKAGHYKGGGPPQKATLEEKITGRGWNGGAWGLLRGCARGTRRASA